MDIDARLKGLEDELVGLLEKLRRMSDRYEELSNTPSYGEEVNALLKLRSLDATRDIYEAHLALVRRLLGGTDQLPLANWLKRELAGETLVLDPTTRELRPYEGD